MARRGRYSGLFTLIVLGGAAFLYFVIFVSPYESAEGLVRRALYVASGIDRYMFTLERYIPGLEPDVVEGSVHGSNVSFTISRGTADGPSLDLEVVQSENSSRSRSADGQESVSPVVLTDLLGDTPIGYVVTVLNDVRQVERLPDAREDGEPRYRFGLQGNVVDHSNSANSIYSTATEYGRARGELWLDSEYRVRRLRLDMWSLDGYPYGSIWMSFRYPNSLRPPA